MSLQTISSIRGGRDRLTFLLLVVLSVTGCESFPTEARVQLQEKYGQPDLRLELDYHHVSCLWGFVNAGWVEADLPKPGWNRRVSEAKLTAEGEQVFREFRLTNAGTHGWKVLATFRQPVTYNVNITGIRKVSDTIRHVEYVLDVEQSVTPIRSKVLSNTPDNELLAIRAGEDAAYANVLARCVFRNQQLAVIPKLGDTFVEKFARYTDGWRMDGEVR